MIRTTHWVTLAAARTVNEALQNLQTAATIGAVYRPQRGRQSDGRGKAFARGRRDIFYQQASRGFPAADEGDLYLQATPTVSSQRSRSTHTTASAGIQIRGRQPFSTC